MRSRWDLDGPHSTTLELPYLTLLREPLGFGNLRGGHDTCDYISIFCCVLLLVTRVAGCCEDIHIRRLLAIQRGHPELAGASVSYQRCVEPLSKLVYPLVGRIREDDITFQVVDSLIAATGGDSSAEGTAKLFAALRLLNSDILLIGHVPKPQGDGTEITSIYGSVFNKNLARSTWEISKAQEVGEDTIFQSLANRKVNLSRQYHPLGLKVNSAC